MTDNALAPKPADPFAEDLIADMMRLGLRQYSEVGVPMFLVAENLRDPPPAESRLPAHWQDIASLFEHRAGLLRSHKPDLDARDVARLVEVFADRYIVADTVPRFSAIPEKIAQASQDRSALTSAATSAKRAGTGIGGDDPQADRTSLRQSDD